MRQRQKRVFYGICGHCCLPLKEPRRNDFCRECNYKGSKWRVAQEAKDRKEMWDDGNGRKRLQKEPARDTEVIKIAPGCTLYVGSDSIKLNMFSKIDGKRSRAMRSLNYIVKGDVDLAKDIAKQVAVYTKTIEANDAFDKAVKDFMGDDFVVFKGMRK